MTAMRPADCGDRTGVAGCRKPAIDGGPDSPTRKRRIAFAAMAGDEQDQAVAGGNCALEASVNRLPSGIEAVPVKVDNPVGLDASARQAAVPACVERDANAATRSFRGFRGRSHRCLDRGTFGWRYRDMWIVLVTR